MVVRGTIVSHRRNYSLFDLSLQNGIVTQVGIAETYIRKGRYVLSWKTIRPIVEAGTSFCKELFTDLYDIEVALREIIDRSRLIA